MKALEELRDKAAREPLGTDISDFGDEWCAGFLAGQVNALDELQRLGYTISPTESDSTGNVANADNDSRPLGAE